MSTLEIKDNKLSYIYHTDTGEWYCRNENESIWKLISFDNNESQKRMCKYCNTVHDKTNCPNCGGN